ncbi:MAG: glutaredoxin family protein [Naasia sp.]
MTTVTIYTKPGCHLCDVAREIVGTVLADYPDDVVELGEIDILGDESLVAEYGEKIPVVTIDDVVHSIWRVDAGRFREAVEQTR